MGQILHGSATTTEAIRRAIQNSQVSLRELAARYGINPKTVAKWRRRGSVCDARMGTREVVSRVFRTFGLGRAAPGTGSSGGGTSHLLVPRSSMFKYRLVDHAVPAMCKLYRAKF
jgi:hypothetical protein